MFRGGGGIKSASLSLQMGFVGMMAGGALALPPSTGNSLVLENNDWKMMIPKMVLENVSLLSRDSPA